VPPGRALLIACLRVWTSAKNCIEIAKNFRLRPLKIARQQQNAFLTHHKLSARRSTNAAVYSTYGTCFVADNVSRFKNDIDRLSRDGDLLLHSMKMRVMGKQKFKDAIIKINGEEKAEKILNKIPEFNRFYETWYSEYVALLRQLLPDRVKNFVELYEKPKNRKSIEFGNYVLQDFLQGLTVKFGDITKVDISAALPQMEQQVAIVSAAKVRFESSLFEIRQIIQADLFDNELLAARELHKNKFFRAAGAMTGVLLEKHLKEVCASHSISIAKKSHY